MMIIIIIIRREWRRESRKHNNNNCYANFDSPVSSFSMKRRPCVRTEDQRPASHFRHYYIVCKNIDSPARSSTPRVIKVYFIAFVSNIIIIVVRESISSRVINFEFYRNDNLLFNHCSADMYTVDWTGMNVIRRRIVFSLTSRTVKCRLNFNIFSLVASNNA